MKLKFFLLIAAFMLSFSIASAGVVVIEIDNPEAVTFSVTLDMKPVPLVKGVNRIEYADNEIYYMTPNPGYEISELKAYEADGKEALTPDWTQNVWNGEYSTSFIRQNDGWRYVFTTAKK